MFWDRKRFVILLLPLVFAGADAATTRKPAEVVSHHIDALKEADIDGLVADYAADAVVVLPMGTFSGIDEIRRMFETYFAQDKENTHLKWDASAEPHANGMVIERWTFYRGEPRENSGTDVMVVRNGKVVFHSMGPDAACKTK